MLGMRWVEYSCRYLPQRHYIESYVEWTLAHNLVKFTLLSAFDAIDGDDGVDDDADDDWASNPSECSGAFTK